MRRLAVLLLLAACEPPPPETILAGRRVIVIRDAGVPDAGRADAGRADAGTLVRDAGVFVVDGGLELDDGGALDFDAGVVEMADGGSACGEDCTCVIRFDHSGGGAFISSIELPCCSTLCLGGSPTAWTCHEDGRITTAPVNQVCRGP